MWEKKIEGAKDLYIFLSHIFLSDRKTSWGQNLSLPAVSPASAIRYDLQKTSSLSHY
jgi:hypothetical protein